MEILVFLDEFIQNHTTEELTSAPFLLFFLLKDVLFFFLLDFIEDCGRQTDGAFV